MPGSGSTSDQPKSGAVWRARVKSAQERSECKTFLLLLYFMSPWKNLANTWSTVTSKHQRNSYSPVNL